MRAQPRTEAIEYEFRDDVLAPPDGIVSESPVLREALAQMARVAPTDATVLITGETGTGKELLARALHRRSRRAARPLFVAHLAATPDALIGSELFGHEIGAFTGAVARRIGRFEMADRATLFLDEIGETSPEVQVSMLRVVQEGTFERLGGSQTKQVDVRLIAATNHDLEQAVDAGTFRADLFYRLSVFPIHLPPLRDRREDVAPLAEYFLRDVESRLARRFDGIDPASIEQLVAYDWPGNIRQLQNVIEHSAILCDEPMLRVPSILLSGKSARSAPASRLATALQDRERQLIEHALQQTEGRVAGPTGAAALLGVPGSTLESKIKRYSIDKLRFRIPRS